MNRSTMNPLCSTERKPQDKKAPRTWLSKCCRKGTGENAKEQTKGPIDVIPLLIEEELKRANDLARKTPLMLAIMRGEIDKAKTLIKEGANLSETDRYGNTAMHIALCTGHHEVSQCIMEHSGDCTVKNVDDVTPLHLVAEGKQVKLGSKFIRRGADVNATDVKGRTPLMLACRSGHFPMVSMLLKYGSDPKAVDCNGWTAADYASSMGNSQIRNQLDLYVKSNVHSTTKIDEDDISSLFSDEDEKESLRGPRLSCHAIPIKVQIDNANKHQGPGMTLMRRLIMEMGDEKTELEIRKIRDEEGNLLPLEELLTNMQSSATHLDDVFLWVAQHQKIMESKNKQYKELEQRINKLVEGTSEMLHTNKNLRKKIRYLATIAEDAPSKDEANALSDEIAILKQGLLELGKEQSREEGQREKVKSFLTDIQQKHENTREAFKLRTDGAEKANVAFSEKLGALKKRINGTTEELKKREKKAEELANFLTIFLRGIYGLMQEKPGQFIKVAETLKALEQKIYDTRGNYNDTREKYLQLGKQTDELGVKIGSIKKHLCKIQNQLDLTPITRKLISMGILEKEEEKRGEDWVERTPEEKLYDPTGLLSKPVHERTGCRSTTEAVRYSWTEAPASEDVKDKLLVILKEGATSERGKNDASTINLATSEESINDLETKSVDDEVLLADLQEKLRNVVAKYKKK